MLSVYICLLNIAGLLVLANFIYFLFCTNTVDIKRFKEIKVICIDYLLCAIAYVFAIKSQTEMLANIGYCAYYILVDWMLFFLILFTRQYTKSIENTSLMVGVSLVVAILDSASIVTNLKFNHVFWLEHTEIENNVMAFLPKHNDYMYVHATFTVILFIVVFVIFVKRLLQVGSFYKMRYISVILMLGILGIAKIFCDLGDVDIDICLILFGFSIIVIGHFAISENTKGFAEYMLATITERMDCALVAFDEFDNCIYSNQLAGKIFGENYSKERYVEIFLDWKQGQKTQSIDNCTWTQSIEIKGEECRFDIRFCKIFDRKGMFNGCYFSFYDVTSDYIAYEEEKYRLSHDSLTGAQNKSSFFEKVAVMLKNDEEYLMACTNVKGLKLINDMFGLETADRVLIKMSEVISKRINESCEYARLEADRFAIILPKDDFSEKEFMDGIREVEGVFDNSQYKLNIQIGIYEIFDKTIPISAMCDRASMAIDSIKGIYKSQIAYYGDVLKTEYLNGQRIMAEFETALEEGQFTIFLQPIMQAHGDIVMAEALARWNHPTRGLIPPAEFVPVLENTGYIYKLDKYIWELAAKRLVHWKKLGRTDLAISVNISVKDFYYIDIYETFTGLVKKYELNPANLKLEITESVFMVEKERQLDIINQLRHFGFSVEIDDFGSGFSSLNMLKEVNSNILKVDMAFLETTEHEEKGKMIVNSVINLAKDLGMETVVEGVETKEQLAYLVEQGCTMVQGYFFDKPLPVDDFEEKYL